MTELPLQFCVRTTMGTRTGFALFRWSIGGLDAEGTQVHVIKESWHGDRFYNIITYVPQSLAYNTVSSRKNSGNIVRPLKWAFTVERLEVNGTRIPALKISRMDHLPVIHERSFIPVVEPPPVLPVGVPATPVVPAVVKKTYTIQTIPKHTVEAILRDAMFHNELCPITCDEIDVKTGAVTSCFHVFEKNAIERWVGVPKNLDKCPVCNAPCNVYYA